MDDHITVCYLFRLKNKRCIIVAYSVPAVRFLDCWERVDSVPVVRGLDCWERGIEMGTSEKCLQVVSLEVP